MYKPTVKAATMREDPERSGQGSIIHRNHRSADETAVSIISRLKGSQQIRSRLTSTERTIMREPMSHEAERRNLI